MFFTCEESSAIDSPTPRDGLDIGALVTELLAGNVVRAQEEGAN